MALALILLALEFGCHIILKRFHATDNQCSKNRSSRIWISPTAKVLFIIFSNSLCFPLKDAMRMRQCRKSMIGPHMKSMEMQIITFHMAVKWTSFRIWKQMTPKLLMHPSTIHENISKRWITSRSGFVYVSPEKRYSRHLLQSMGQCSMIIEKSSPLNEYWEFPLES